MAAFRVKSFQANRILPAAVFLFVAVLYLLTMAPSVVEIDSGELAAVQSVLGIAHPTGYPLFTVLGSAFLKIPIFASKIAQLNLLSVVWCLTGLFFIFKCLKILTQEDSQSSRTLSVPASKGKKKTPATVDRNRRHGLLDGIPALAGTLFLGFSLTFWKQSGTVEVYSLHIFLAGLILYFMMRTVRTEKPATADWFAVAAALALGFSNHMTTLLILPGLAYLFFRREGFRSHAWKTILLMLGIFVPLWCLIQLYLPVRAAQGPILNWGNPVTWENWMRHILGKQYRVWLFSSSDAAIENLRTFLDTLPGELTWPGFALGILGFFSALGRLRGITLFLIITFVFTVIYAVNYDIHDIETYFLLAYIVFAFWIASGIRWGLDRIRGKTSRILAVSLVAAGIGFAAVRHFPEADRSDLHVFEDYAKQALGSLPEDAVLISYQWDYLISPAYYFQFVENYRRDVAIVDKELLRRSWYFDQLRSGYPVLLEDVEPEVESFLEALAPFERGKRYDARLLEARYRNLIARLIEANMTRGDVFIAPELVQAEIRRGDVHLPQGVRLIPDAFFFRAVRTDAYIPSEVTEIRIRFPSKGNHYTNTLRNFVSNAFTWRALYELQHSKTEKARLLTHQLTEHFPGLQLPPVLRSL